MKEIVDELRAVLTSSGREFGATKWYIFGSASRSRKYAADIDLLVICANDEVADHLRSIFSRYNFHRPMDLSILTEQEEEEISFVERQHCIRIFLPEE